MTNPTLFEDFCRTCGSFNTVEIPEPPNSIHHSRLACADCHSFIKWITKAKVPQVCITRLLQNSTLQAWERQFLKTMLFRTPTSAEKIVIDAIKERVKTSA